MVRTQTHARARTHMHTTIRWALDMAKARVVCISTVCPPTAGSKFAPLFSGYPETPSNLPDNTNLLYVIYVCWTVHHLDSWIKIDQLNVTWFIISLFTAQHFSNVSTSIFRSLRLIVGLFHGLCCSGSMCVGVTVWFGWGGVVSLCRLKH